MLATLVYAAPWLLGVVCIVSLAQAYTHLRRARQAPYFRIRRDAARRGWRWVIVLIISGGGVVGLVSARSIVPPPQNTLRTLFLASPTPFPTIAPPPSPTSDFGLTGTAQNALEETPATLLTPETLTVEVSPFISTINSPVTPSASAKLTITGVSSGISADRTPVDLNTIFPVGIPRVYYWFEFGNITEGISWSQVLLLNGSVIRSESEEWNRGESGSAYYWFGAQGGWPAGTYEIQFYLGDRMMSSATYTVQD
jgi:hypothetical protein